MRSRKEINTGSVRKYQERCVCGGGGGVYTHIT